MMAPFGSDMENSGLLAAADHRGTLRSAHPQPSTLPPCTDWPGSRRDRLRRQRRPDRTRSVNSPRRRAESPSEGHQHIASLSLEQPERLLCGLTSGPRAQFRECGAVVLPRPTCGDRDPLGEHPQRRHGRVQHRWRGNAQSAPGSQAFASDRPSPSRKRTTGTCRKVGIGYRVRTPVRAQEDVRRQSTASGQRSTVSPSRMASETVT